MGWQDYASAPPSGTELCRVDALVTTLALSVGEKGFPVLLVATPDGPRAYVNACPHQYLPLTYRSDQVLSADGARLMCSAHGAEFDVRDGEALAGADCALDAVPLRVEGGMLVIG